MILPKGKYYVGDPCYIFHKSWGDVLIETEFFGKEVQTINGIPVFGGSTMYGDGTYFDQDHRSYAVDSGTLAAIPVELIKVDGDEDIESVGSSNYMHIIDFPEDFECVLEDGEFRFGHIIIDTEGHEEDEEDLFDDDDDEDEIDDDESDEDEDEERVNWAI